jgi:hypothetical protein
VIHNPAATRSSLSDLSEIRHIVLVEGSDDASIVHLILEGMLDTPLVYVVGGEPNFRQVISLLKDLRGFSSVKSISIVRDANGDPQAKIASCRDIFQSQQLAAPNRPLEVAEGNLRTGIVLMPAVGQGSLESVLLDAYPAPDHPNHARAFVSAIDSDDPGAGAWTQGQAAKRLLRALLGIGSKRLGIDLNSIVPRAACGGLWSIDATAFEPYRTYFSALQEASSAQD